MTRRSRTYLHLTICVVVFLTWVLYHISSTKDVVTEKTPSSPPQLPPHPLVSRPHSQAHEYRIRHLRDDVTEWWRYMTSRMEKNVKLAAGNVTLTKRLNETLKEAREYYQAIMKNVWAISGRGDDWKRAENEKLSSLIQSRIHKVQNPPDCNKARKLICEMADTSHLGITACIHHVSMCLCFAYITGRTLIMQETGEWQYLPDGWTSVFLPLSDTCTTSDGTYVFWGDHTPDTPTVRLRAIPYIRKRLPDQYRAAIPSDIAERIISFHSNPSLWFHAQFIKYTMRMLPEMQKYMTEMAAAAGFKHPIVGIQVRRTDKVLEARHYVQDTLVYNLSAYTRLADEYFGVLSTAAKLSERRVFLATDEPQVLQEALTSYGDYKWVYNTNGASTALNRHGMQIAKTVLLEVLMLSMCDHIVCTLTSNVCLLAVELQQLRGQDTANAFDSLDWPYHYNKQLGVCVAWKAHVQRDISEIDLRVGDVIIDCRNDWDGFSKGRNERTNMYGRYPTFKARAAVPVVDFDQTLV